VYNNEETDEDLENCGFQIHRIIPLHHNEYTGKLQSEWYEYTLGLLDESELIDPRPLQDVVYEQKEELEIKRGLRRDKKRSGAA
jgi:hypothetical protein